MQDSQTIDYSVPQNVMKLRFVGSGMSGRGVDAVDLAHSLISAQQLVNQDYLAQNQRLNSRAGLKPDEIESLRLSVGKRVSQSDAFYLDMASTVFTLSQIGWWAAKVYGEEFALYCQRTNRYLGYRKK